MTSGLPPSGSFCVFYDAEAVLCCVKGSSDASGSPEELRWVDMNPVTGKSSELGGRKYYQEEECIFKLVQKGKTSQELGNTCPSAGRLFFFFFFPAYFYLNSN